MPTKILFVITELRPGGAEKCLVNLAIGIDRAAFDPIVVVLGSAPPTNQSRLVEQLQKANVPTHFLKCDSKFQLWKAIRLLRKTIVENDVTLVQSFLFHANVVAGLALRKLDSVRFYAGIRVADPSWTRHKLEKWATKNAQKIVCVSQSVADFSKKKMNLRKDKLVAIPNGVSDSTEQNDSTQNELGVSQPFVVFVGRLEKQKGLVPFLQFFKQWESKIPPFDFVFIGEGSLEEELKELTGQLNRPSHFLGWLDHPHSLIQQSELLVLPSLWEGMPNVLLETMSLGKPFVAFQVDGVKELMNDSSIQLVEPGNYQGFMENLTELIDNKELAAKHGNQNQTHIQNHFSIKKMIASYESLYLADSI